jgi:LPS sulfotransferase NodH
MRRWWLYPHRPYKPIFVLATYRSGSNLLRDYLNCLPGVRCLPEVLCPTLPIGLSRYQQQPDRALQHIRYSLQALKQPIRGCKLMLDQLEGYGLTIEALDDAFPGAKYIVLYRESLADQFLSHKTAHATKQWVLHAGQTAKHAQIVVQPAELQHYCEGVRRAYQRALACPRLAGRSAIISYEQLTAEPQYWLDEQICPLLGIPPTRAKSSLRKQSTRPVAERVRNYADVAALLASPHCWQRDLAIGGGRSHAKVC